MSSENEIQDKIRNLVIARLRSTPPNMGIIIGSNSDKQYSPSELIKEIENHSTLGEEYVEMDIDFLRDLQKGLLYD